jgi:hypothetical protein
METQLNFENSDVRELLSELDFRYFLDQNIKEEGYGQSEIDLIYSSHKEWVKTIKNDAKGNKKQFNFYVEGQVRKMFTGGLLPTLFHLNEAREHVIFDFPGTGENWAYFDHWRQLENPVKETSQFRVKVTTH